MLDFSVFLHVSPIDFNTSVTTVWPHSLTFRFLGCDPEIGFHAPYWRMSRFLKCSSKTEERRSFSGSCEWGGTGVIFAEVFFNTSAEKDVTQLEHSNHGGARSLEMFLLHSFVSSELTKPSPFTVCYPPWWHFTLTSFISYCAMLWVAFVLNGQRS